MSGAARSRQHEEKPPCRLQGSTTATGLGTRPRLVQLSAYRMAAQAAQQQGWDALKTESSSGLKFLEAEMHVHTQTACSFSYLSNIELEKVAALLVVCAAP